MPDVEKFEESLKQNLTCEFETEEIKYQTNALNTLVYIDIDMGNDKNHSKATTIAIIPIMRTKVNCLKEIKKSCYEAGFAGEAYKIEINENISKNPFITKSPMMNTCPKIAKKTSKPDFEQLKEILIQLFREKFKYKINQIPYKETGDTVSETMLATVHLYLSENKMLEYKINCLGCSIGDVANMAALSLENSGYPKEKIGSDEIKIRTSSKSIFIKGGK